MSDQYAPEIIAQIKALQVDVERLKVVEQQSFRACEVYNSSNQSIAGAIQSLAWTSETYDRGGFHDNAVNNSRLTVPADQAGIYVVSLNLNWEADGGAATMRYTYIRLNNTADIASASTYLPLGINGFASLSVVRLLAAGDYVEAYVAHSSAGARNILATAGISPYFAIAQIAKTV